MDVKPETRERILAAANALFEEAGRIDLPTLDAVRKRSRTNMADASAVMKEWRRLQTMAASTPVVAVPDKVTQAGHSAIAALWAEAQALATEGLNVAQAAWDTERAEAEKQRVELSGAFDAQGAELETLKASIAKLEQDTRDAAAAASEERADLQRQMAALTDQAHTAAARAEEIAKRAEDLKTALEAAQAALHRQSEEAQAQREQHDVARAQLNTLTPELATAKTQLTQVVAELTAEREQHQKNRTRLEALTTETATVSARLEAQSGVQRDVAERLKRTEGELSESRAAAAAAREEAAQLRGQAGALQTQITDLLQALNLRESSRDSDRPKKQ
jgi:colicin import membrane protein